MGDRLARGVDAEDAARLLGRVVVGGVGAGSAGGHPLMIARLFGDPCNTGEHRATAGEHRAQAARAVGQPVNRARPGRGFAGDAGGGGLGFLPVTGSAGPPPSHTWKRAMPMTPERGRSLV